MAYGCVVSHVQDMVALVDEVADGDSCCGLVGQMLHCF